MSLDIEAKRIWDVAPGPFFGFVQWVKGDESSNEIGRLCGFIVRGRGRVRRRFLFWTNLVESIVTCGWIL